MPRGSVVDVTVCIACHRVDGPGECTGDCADRRLLLVEADALDAAERVLAEARSATARGGAVLDALVAAAAGEPEAEAAYRELRESAREALRGPHPVLPAAPPVTSTWRCNTCGRIEAPQPCLGVCVKQAVAMVPAADYDATREEAAAALAALERQVPVLRALASVTPRPGRWAEALDALRRQAAGAGRLD